MNKEANKILTDYLNLMIEIRRREKVIISIYENKSNVLYNIVNYEVMFFQLRKILEIIAKAPMLINEIEYRNITPNADRDWRIEPIMTKLKKINSEFYPKSIEIIKKENQIDEFRNRDSGYLTPDELCEAYKYCNSYLHSRNPLIEDSEVDFDIEWNYIVEILNKIHVLLDGHICHPTSDGEFYFISMDNGNGIPAGNVFTQK